MKTFPATLDHLYAMLAHVHEHGIEFGFSDDVLSKIELAVEEALVNIIHYAYPHGQGTIALKCSILEGPHALMIEIRDTGIPFNPLEFSMDSTPQNGIGGYGIFYIKKIMDEVLYDRKDNANVLTLKLYRDRL